MQYTVQTFPFFLFLVFTLPSDHLPDCSTLGDVDLEILPLEVREDYPTTGNTSDGSLYVLSIIGVGDVPMIIFR